MKTNSFVTFIILNKIMSSIRKKCSLIKLYLLLFYLIFTALMHLDLMI